MSYSAFSRRSRDRLRGLDFNRSSSTEVPPNISIGSLSFDLNMQTMMIFAYVQITLKPSTFEQMEFTDSKINIFRSGFSRFFLIFIEPGSATLAKLGIEFLNAKKG